MSFIHSTKDQSGLAVHWRLSLGASDR